MWCGGITRLASVNAPRGYYSRKVIKVLGETIPIMPKRGVFLVLVLLAMLMVPVQAAQSTTIDATFFFSTNFLYAIGGISVVLFIVAGNVDKNEWIPAGITTLFSMTAGFVATRIDFVKIYYLYDPPIYLSNGVAISNATALTTTVHLVQPMIIIAGLFFILAGISFVNTIRSYYNEQIVGEEM